MSQQLVFDDIWQVLFSLSAMHTHVSFPMRQRGNHLSSWQIGFLKLAQSFVLRIAPTSSRDCVWVSDSFWLKVASAPGSLARVPSVAMTSFHFRQVLPTVGPLGLKVSSSPSIRNLPESKKKNPCRLIVMFRQIPTRFKGSVSWGCLPTGKNTHQRTSRLPDEPSSVGGCDVIMVAKCGSPLTGQLALV